MKREKVTYIKEKQLERQTQENFDAIIDKYAENPIKAKFLAFQKTRKTITPKDII